jgi:hypothetical protein
LHYNFVMTLYVSILLESIYLNCSTFNIILIRNSWKIYKKPYFEDKKQKPLPPTLFILLHKPRVTIDFVHVHSCRNQPVSLCFIAISLNMLGNKEITSKETSSSSSSISNSRSFPVNSMEFLMSKPGGGVYCFQFL